MKTLMKRTPLYEINKKLGARFVDFAGWKMPIQFTSILEEAKTVRQSAGVFDVSHMGRLFIEGERVEEFLNYVTSNNVSKMENGDVQYSLILNEKGGTVDDITVYKFSDTKFMLCVNAANLEKDKEHLNKYNSFGVSIEDKSPELVQIALQGPKAVEILKKYYPGVEKLKYYTFTTFGDTIVSRTGYTGEDGFEIYIPVKEGIELYKKLVKEAKPCGLGARDILRIEAGYPLYGHELSDDRDLREANLTKFIDLSKKNFVGKEALLKREPKYKLRGLILSKRTVARQGDKVFKGDKQIGEVSSGTFSPNLNTSIALAFLSVENMPNYGDKVEVEVRNRRVEAEVRKPRFINHIPKEILKR
jgi:aminomethyltransferase